MSKKNIKKSVKKSVRKIFQKYMLKKSVKKSVEKSIQIWRNTLFLLRGLRLDYVLTFFILKHVDVFFVNHHTAVALIIWVTEKEKTKNKKNSKFSNLSGRNNHSLSV